MNQEDQCYSNSKLECDTRYNVANKVSWFVRQRLNAATNWTLLQESTRKRSQCGVLKTNWLKWNI